MNKSILDKCKGQSSLFWLYVFGLISHSLMLLIFLFYDITIMMWFNVGSVLLYIILLIVSTKNKNISVHSVAGDCSMTEVIVHQIVGIICLGMDVGFQYFIIMIIAVVILQPREVLRKNIKIVCCIAGIAILIFLELYASCHKPLYYLPVGIERVMLVAITTISVLGLILFCMKQWNTSEHYRRQIEVLLNERTTKIFQMQEKIIGNFADIIEKRDGSTGGHIKRTSAYVEAIVEALKANSRYSSELSDEYIKMVVSAAPLHDIGKISISDSILCKKGRLTDEEYDIMKTHSAIGAGMLEELLGELESEDYVSLAYDIARYHHEKWNGKGYPDGLREEEIPLSARIMAVADVFDALTSERVYKEKYSIDRAYEIMSSEAGQQFDPDIIREFIRIRSSISEICISFSEPD